MVADETEGAALLEIRVGDSTVGENLDRAGREGLVTGHDDGTWSLNALPVQLENWAFGPTPTPFPCTRLMGFLFRGAYGRAAVPFGCRTCFKVRAAPRTLRELHAVHRVALSLAHACKSGVGLGSRYQAGPYVTMFYLASLEAARDAHAEIRAALAEDPVTRDVPLTIKRGCTEYEVFCGPSDRFSFPPGMEAVETALLARLRAVPKPAFPDRRTVFMRWVQAAYQIGDETYKDFTNGAPLYPAAVTYPPRADPE